MKIRALVILLVSLLLLAGASAYAGGDDAEAVKKHIAVLVHEAGALKAEGRHDAAEVLWKRAHELKSRMAERATGASRVPLSMEQAEKVLHGLEMGMESLKTLRREAELKAVAKVANEMRERMQKARAAKREDHAEIKEAKRQLEILRLAFHGLREGEKREAMELMEHAIHALELGIAGRRDDEAMEIRKTSPDRGTRIELLQLAAGIWERFGHEGKAGTITELAEKMAAQTRQRTKRAKREKGEKSQRELGNREIHKRRLKVLRHALAAFREDEKPRLIEQTERAVHAYEFALAGREDEEAQAAWRRAPEREHLAELLGYAAHLYAEWGHEDRAHLCKNFSQELLATAENRRERPAVSNEQLERLHRQFRNIQEMVQKLERELKALKR